MNVMGCRVIRKPYYGIEEVCQRWEISQTDLAGFVIEQEIALSAIVPRVRVQFGIIEYDDDGQGHKMLEGYKYLSGAVDLLPLDGWYTLTTNFHPIHSFKSENGTYMDIVLEKFDSSAFSVHPSELVVRHAELTRFEAAQAAMEATPPIMRTLAAPQAAGRGAPAKYKWDDFYCALAVMTHAEGKGKSYPGEHAAIIPQALWNQVHEIMASNPHMRAGLARNRSPALLRGLIFGADGRALSPTHTRKQGRLYRYYVSQSVLKGGADDAPYRRLPAGEIEALVLDQLRALLRQPEVVVGTWRAAQAEAPDLTEDTVREALARFDPVWSELFPAEQERLIRLLVQRVVVGEAGAQISLNLEGLASLARDLSQPKRIAA
jgi:hypothetical protein